MRKLEKITSIEGIGKCFECKKIIGYEDSYVEILHYMPPPTRSKRRHYCEKCFEDIAGKEFM